MKNVNKIFLSVWAVVAFFGFTNKANAEDFKITGKFEGAEVSSTFVYRSTSAGLDVDYHSAAIKNTLHYHVRKFDECSLMGMYVIPQSNQMAIDGSCPSQGGQIFRYVYQWTPSHGTWCLVREITGERPDISANTVVPSEHVVRVTGCAEMGASGPYSYESDTKVAAEVKDELSKFVNASKNQSDLKAYLASMPSYAVSELVLYVEASNVEPINNLAFYLIENGRSYEAIPILASIVNEFPNRTVARLNLADAYWNNEFKVQAAGQYKEYLEKMSRSGKSDLVPKRVAERTNPHAAPR